MRGDWRDLRTVFNAIGLTPRGPNLPKIPIHQKIKKQFIKARVGASGLARALFRSPSRAGKTRFRECLGKGTTSVVLSRSQRTSGFSL
jgi:hypothetical protein